MNRIITIFNKELKDTVRDRKAMFFMLVFPMIVFPLLIGGVTTIQMNIMKKEQAKQLKVAIVGKDFPAELSRDFLSDTSIAIYNIASFEEADSLIKTDSLDIALGAETGFPSKIEAHKSGMIYLHFKTEDEMVKIIKKRISGKIDAYAHDIRLERLRTLRLTEEFSDPVKIVETDLATARERLGKTIGGMLPYIFILFCFMGAMYPAIDLGAGEKERGTLETLLVAPASRMEILYGKFGVITLSGLLSSVVSLLGIFVSLQFVDEIPPELHAIVSDILQPSTVILILSLMIPITLLFAALLLILSIYAKSFKEAQSIITPLNIAVIFPVLIGSLIPGIHLNLTTSLIPIINVSLACKEAIAGTGEFLPFSLVFISSFLYAAMGIYACSKWIQKEHIIFRN
ncbi:MAG: ABC transporter permease subunit [Candidatus Marinimicrobia bacterium]|jgi:sodium transport system permease protein|nr:ABC transporter permease subunit [Candidatus Neomarinimicrobiota bacterium]